jgi:hypothetical protein
MAITKVVSFWNGWCAQFVNTRKSTSLFFNVLDDYREAQVFLTFYVLDGLAYRSSVCLYIYTEPNVWNLGICFWYFDVLDVHHDGRFFLKRFIFWIGVIMSTDKSQEPRFFCL